MNDDAEQLLAAGRGLYYTGKFAKAEQTLERAVALDAKRADAWFMLGMAHRSLGRQPQAIDACREAVRLDARHAAAHNLLGILLAETGQSAEAIDEFQRALAIMPDNADTHFNLGLVLLQQQRVAEAVEAWRATIRLRPAHAGAQAMLQEYAPRPPQAARFATSQAQVGGGMLTVPCNDEAHENVEPQLKTARDAFERGDSAVAEGVCREVLKRNPHDAHALQHLGVILISRGEPEEAAELLQRAVAIEPTNHEMHYTLGCALAKLEDNQEAIAHFLEVLTLKPNYVLAHIKLGDRLAACKQYTQAEFHLRRALELQPKSAEAHCTLGCLFTSIGRNAEAEVFFGEALRLKPDYHVAWNGLAGALARQGRFAAAEECYAGALRFDRHMPEIRYNRSLTWLAQGRWLEAWPDYEYRFSTPELTGRQITERPWHGEALYGRTILLYADQALGDTLQAVRYAPLVAARGGRVLLAVQRALLPLLAKLRGVRELLDRSVPPPHFDVQAALMSLPGLFGTTPDNVPADVPYLSADPALVEQWRKRLASRERSQELEVSSQDQRPNNPKSKIQNPKSLLVGIAWQGNPHFRPGLHRSIPLAEFEPLARLPGVQLISLQKGQGSEQITQVPFADKIRDFSLGLDEESGPFMDTAAIMTQLDLVISCDTALAHLAGALAVPVWVALPAVAEWRWLLDRDDTPWYPTMRLFRQRDPGNWSEVFERVAQAIKEKLGLGSSESD